MTHMQKRPDMQIVGAKIAHLRREKGMCIAAFARELEQPAWLISLVENAHDERSASLIELLPDSVIEELLREIHEVFGVSYYWLTTRYQSPKHPPLTYDSFPPKPMMYLPISVDPEDAIALLDDILTLTLSTSNLSSERECIFRHTVITVTKLFQLQLAALEHEGHPELAQLMRHKYQQMLQERIKHLAGPHGFSTSMHVNSLAS